jgi:hypothetical protein
MRFRSEVAAGAICYFRTVTTMQGRQPHRWPALSQIAFHEQEVEVRQAAFGGLRNEIDMRVQRAALPATPPSTQQNAVRTCCYRPKCERRRAFM